MDHARVLVIGPGRGDGDIARHFDAETQVSVVASHEEALQQLRSAPYDWVLCEAGAFIPIQGVHSAGQAAAIIDSVSQGIGIFRQSGELDWANPAMLALSDEVRERVKHFCVETWHLAIEKMNAGSKQIRGRRFSFQTAKNEKFEVTATPVADAQHHVTQVAAVVWDATTTSRLQDQIDAIDQAGRELLCMDVEQVSRLEPQERLALLEQKILRCTRELLHFDNFEIRILDKNSGRLEQVLAYGMPNAVANLEIYAEGEGNGISGFVATSRRSYICPSTADDPRYIPGVVGAKSSLTVPLTLHDQVVGVANFESTRLAAFNENDRRFSEIFGRYVALALHILRLLACERQTTTGLVGTNVLQEITGPVNDIVTDVETLLEDYIGHDDLRVRLRTISENAARIRQDIKDITAARPAVWGVRSPKGGKQDEFLAGRRVLLADDEDIIRETVRDVLTGYGCIVHTASDGATALDLIAREPFDLVLSDIKMPIKNGYEVFAAAKQANPKTPVILTTGFGYDPNHTIIRARREGLAAVLFKPFKVDQLLGEIRSALKSAAS